MWNSRNSPSEIRVGKIIRSGIMRKPISYSAEQDLGEETGPREITSGLHGILLAGRECKTVKSWLCAT
jgi:hypothetical protein